jgi:DNA-binding NtrC family response regulator
MGQVAKGRGVLLVDDDVRILAALGRALKGSSVEPRFARNADEALRLAHAEEPLGMVTDYGLPGLDGVELIERIRRRYPKIPCILHTADEVRSPGSKGKRVLEDVPVLFKPCTAASFRKAVEGLARRA